MLHYLWKAVENHRRSLQTLSLASATVGFSGVRPVPASFPAPGLSACSACAGEYEDPDETTWTEVPDPDQEQQLEQEEFLCGATSPLVGPGLALLVTLSMGHRKREVTVAR